MRKAGFTLIELVVVIAIIAILATIITPNAFRAIEKAKVAKVEGDFKAIKTAVMAYYADTGKWPPSDQCHSQSGGTAANDITVETQNFVTGENQPAGWDGPYVEKWPMSPFRGEGWFSTQQNYYNYIYACYPWGFADIPNTADIYLQAAFCPVSIAEKIKEDIDGTKDLGPHNYTQQTGRIRWHYSGHFLYYIIVENTNCGGGSIP